MLLAIDAGNTNVVFALVDLSAGTRTIRARWRIATDPRRTGDEYAVWINQLLDTRRPWHGRCRCRHHLDGGAARASQSRSAGAEIFQGRAADRRAAAGRVAHQRRRAHARRRSGADRAVNAIAAHAAYHGDLIIIDFGTATTFDHIDYTGAYKGGIIAPGINLSLDALVNAAAKLPRIAIAVPGR